MAGKDKAAIVICLDVGPMMNQALPGHCSDLKSASDVVNLILRRKLFSESKDEVCLVLFGTPETANRLSNQGYHNITEARPMGPVDLDFINYVKTEVKPSDTSANFVHVLTVAMDIIHTVTSATWSKFTGSKIIMFSNLGGEFSEDREDVKLQAMNDKDTEIIFIGPSSLDDDGDDGPGDGGPDLPGPGTSGKPQMKKKIKSPQQKLGGAKMKAILKVAGGDASIFNDVISRFSFFETELVRPKPWKCNLEIGSDLKVPVCGYIWVKQAIAKPWKFIFVKGANKEYTPKAETSHHLDDEEETEVEGDDIIDGYRYGSDIIPISKGDKANMDYKSPGKVLQVLGFTKSECIKRHQYMGKNVFLFVADPNEHAGVAFSAIVNALYETNTVIIVRRGALARSNPKLGCLIPHIRADYESLLFFELPFAEDLRTYTFASITQNLKYEPSEQQLEAVDKLIDSMDLTADKGDGEGEEEGSETLNPVLQWVYQCLLHRALYPTESIPDIDPMLKASLERPQDVTANSCEAVDEMKKLFKLTEVQRTQKVTAQNVFGTVNQNGDTPSNLVTADGGTDVSMADLSQGTVTEVGTVNPVRDFQQLIQDADKATFEKICQQLQKRTEQLILESLGNQFFNKAWVCLQSLREKTLQRKEPALFNRFLGELKQKLKTTHKLAFWQKLCSEKFTLIVQTECPASDVTEDDCKKFLQDETAAADPQDQEMVDDDADNLLDMME